MESKVLNFPDAMKLAEILDRYDILSEQGGIDRAVKLVNIITPEEYIFILSLCGLGISSLTSPALSISSISILMIDFGLEKMISMYKGISDG